MDAVEELTKKIYQKEEEIDECLRKEQMLYQEQEKRQIQLKQKTSVIEGILNHQYSLMSRCLQESTVDTSELQRQLFSQIGHWQTTLQDAFGQSWHQLNREMDDLQEELCQQKRYLQNELDEYYAQRMRIANEER